MWPMDAMPCSLRAERQWAWHMINKINKIMKDTTYIMLKWQSIDESYCPVHYYTYFNLKHAWD